MEEWMTLVPEVGFPVLVTFYLLHRMEGKLDMLVASIHHLAEQMKVG
ncbi:YvrJ family protein [Pontibacillus salipaludis]